MKFQLNKTLLKFFGISAFLAGIFLLGTVRAGCNSFACCGKHNGICGATCKISSGWYSSCQGTGGVACTKKTSDYCNWNGKRGPDFACVWEKQPYNGCSNNVTCYKCACTSETPCDPGVSVPQTACREQVTTNSCTYYVCPSPSSCSREPRVNSVETALSSPPVCSIVLPSNIRYNSIVSGKYNAYAYDRGDLFRINAFAYSTNACGSVVYADNRDQSFPSALPYIFREMDCSAQGYVRQRSYVENIAFKPAGGAQVEEALDVNNICKVNVISEVKSVGPIEDVFVNQCEQQLSIYYPPTFALSVELFDRNKESVETIDGREAYKLIQDTIVDWVGGVGEDPLQFLASSAVDSLAEKGLCELLEESKNYVYRVGDSNPFWIKVIFWDENGTGDFRVDQQDIYLVNDATGQEYPVSRGIGEVQNQILGLYDVKTAAANRAPSTDGYRVYDASTSLAGALRSCLSQDNVLCTMRFKVEDVSGSTIRHVLQGIDSKHPAYKVKDGLPSAIAANPSLGKRVYIRVYQKALPDGKYFIRVRTKDREGAKYTEDFKGVSFWVDNTLPRLESVLTAYDADILEFNVTISDNNKLPTNRGPAFFAPYIFVQKKDGTKYFLNLLDPNTMKPTAFKVSGTIFGNSLAHAGALFDISDLLKVSLSNGGHTQTVKMYVSGPQGLELSGGDKIYYGVCVYDVAGNISCSRDDLCSIPKPASDGIGNNWLKTSLNNVYSRGGFTQLPDYHQLLNIREYPVLGKGNKIKSLFEKYLEPFASTQATLGNFSLVLGQGGFGGVVWGYNNHFFDSSLPKFGLKGRKIDIDPKEYDYMAKLAKDRCGSMQGMCQTVMIDTKVDTPTEFFKRAVEVIDSPYKIIYLENVNINVDAGLFCKNANVIFVKSSLVRLKGQVVKSRVATNKSLSPFADYTEGCLFILADDSNSRIILDDNPRESAFILGETWAKTVKDSTDTDFMQLAIIGFGDFEGQVTIKQTPRNNYKHNGVYDSLIIHGFIYARGVPRFERDLVFADNTRFPSEWIIFDPSFLALYEPILGRYKIQTFKCGVNNHPWCKIR